MNHEAIDWVFNLPISIPNDKLVLLAVARRVNRHWAAFPSKAELARMTGIAEASIPKCLRRLEQAGHLRRIAFTATNGQDQKPGFVLAGIGQPLDSLDEEFLVLAFAERKQPGMPMTVAPEHWSGERKGEGGSRATLQGGSGATPRSNTYKEAGQSAFGEARDKSLASEDPAIAEVRAAAPTPNTGPSTSGEAKIPKQRTPRPSNKQRNDDWRAQIAAADVDELDGVAASMSVGPGHYDTACRLATYRLGLGADGDVPTGLYPEFVRHMYLYLLKDVAATDPDHLDELAYSLDGSIKAGPAPFKWNESMYVPDGETAASFSARMLQAITRMTPEQVGPWVGEIEDFLPGLWYEKRQEARAQIRARKLPLEIETIGLWAARLMIQHYADKPTPKWPMEVVPPSMRLAAQPPAWAA